MKKSSFEGEKMKKEPPVIELLMVIINREEDEKTVKILSNLRVELQLLSLGVGTADSSLGDYLGLDIKEKSIILALIKLDDSEEILKTLNEKLNFNKKNTGMALTIPVKSAAYSLIERMGFKF